MGYRRIKDGNPISADRDELGLKQKRIPRQREKHVKSLGDMEKHSISEEWRNVWHGWRRG